MRDYHLAIKAGQSVKVAGSESNFILCKAIVDPLATDLPSVRVTAVSSLHEGRVVLQSAFIASQYFKSPINELFTDVEVTNESSTDLSCTFAIGRGDLGDNYTSGLVQIDAISSDVVLKTLPQNLPVTQNVKSASMTAADAVTIQTINNEALCVKLNNGFYEPANFGYSRVWFRGENLPLTAPREGSFKGSVTITVSGFAEDAPISGWLETRLLGKWTDSSTHLVLVSRVKVESDGTDNRFVSVTVPASFEITAALDHFGSVELIGAGFQSNMHVAWYFAGETLV